MTGRIASKRTTNSQCTHWVSDPSPPVSAMAGTPIGNSQQGRAIIGLGAAIASSPSLSQDGAVLEENFETLQKTGPS